MHVDQRWEGLNYDETKMPAWIPLVICAKRMARRHHEDTDAFADALAELCRVDYPQSPPELRQELIAEQFVRGQSDPVY